MKSHTNQRTTDKPRVYLVGPTAPYRGGIAQYTTQLHKAFGRYCDITTISFKRLYPSWLYPGESDKEAIDTEKLKNVENLIDVYSPLTLKLVADRIVASGCDLVIINWWTLFWQPGMAYLAHRLKKRGIKTAFLSHNLFDHDASILKKKISSYLLRQADSFIVHSKEQAEMIRTIKPDAEILHRLHPIYNQFPRPSQKMSKRGRLEVLFFGFIRPYKGLDDLIKAAATLNDKELYVTVLGEAWNNKDNIKARLKSYGAPNLELRLEYANDETVANYFDRADIVALPYLSATGSGVVTIAYYYKKPVLATKVGGLKDAVIEKKTGWVVPPGQPIKLAETLSIIKRSDIAKMKTHITHFCDENSWDNMAKAVLSLVKQ